MRNHRIGVIIQARMGSTRLPRKVLLKLDENESVLDVLIKRMKLSKLINEIIIATTPDKKNYSIIDVAEFHNISYFIGSEDDVLSRYYYAAKKFNLDLIIRITSDCPFVDPKILDDMLKFYINNIFDYVKNFDEKTHYTRGFEIELLSINVLEKVHSWAKTPLEREHVTYFIYTHPELFTIHTYKPNDLKKIEGLRLTIDEEDDLIICKEVYKKLKEKGKLYKFTLIDIYKIIEENPELLKINKNINHKSYKFY